MDHRRELLEYAWTSGLRQCDTVIFLDIARPICLWRVLKRAILYRGRTRPDMAEGCRERLDLGFIRWVWSYQSRTRPQIIELLRQSAQSKQVIWLRSPAEVKRFLAQRTGRLTKA